MVALLECSEIFPPPPPAEAAVSQAPLGQAVVLAVLWVFSRKTVLPVDQVVAKKKPHCYAEAVYPG